MVELLQERGAADRQKPPMFASNELEGFLFIDVEEAERGYNEEREEEEVEDGENGDHPKAEDEDSVYANSMMSIELDGEASLLLPSSPVTENSASSARNSSNSLDLSLNTSRRSSFMRRCTEGEHASHTCGYGHEHGSSSSTHILSRRSSAPSAVLASSKNNLIHMRKEKEELERAKTEEATAEKERVRNFHIRLMRNRRRESENRLLAMEQVCVCVYVCVIPLSVVILTVPCHRCVHTMVYLTPTNRIKLI